MTTVKSRTDAMDSDNNSEMKGTQVISQIQMYLKQNHDDCLASAVEVFATALGFVINNPKLVTSKKSAEILRDAGSESYLLLKNVETQINTNLRRVTDLSQLKTKQLETRLQGCRELSPECCIANKSKLGQENLTRSYLIENKENGLARPVALFSAQGVENELESIISSLELLRAGVLLLLLNLEYPMTTTNLGKLTDLREVKRTDQFVHRRFAEEVEQRLKEYVGRIQYLEEHGIEVKRSEDRQRECISELLKNKRTYSHDPSTCPFVVMSHGCLSGSKPAKFNNQTPAEDNSDMNGYIPQDMDTDVSSSWGGVGSNNGYFDYSGGGNNDDGNDDMLGEDHEVEDDGEGSDDDNGEGSDDDNGEGSDDDNGEGSDDDNGGESDHEFDNALYRPYLFNNDSFWQENEGGHLTEDDCRGRHKKYLKYEDDYSYDYADDHGVHRYVCYDPPEGARPEDIDFIFHHEEKLRRGLTNNQIACPPYWPNAKSGPDGEPIRDWDVNSHIPWHVQLEEKERARRAE